MNNNSTNLTNCDSCDSCDYCYSCTYCDSCDYCDSCNSCYYCYSCKNLKMTEYNLFCWSDSYNDENSFQQKRYRVFNKEVGEDRYYEVLKEVKEIMKDFKLDLKEDSWQEAWKELDKERINKLKEIKEFDAEIFKQITGIELEEEPNNIAGDIIEVNGIKYKKLT